MSYILLFLLFGSTAMIFAETSSEIDRVKERLQNSAKELSIKELLKPPKAASYLNSELIKNAPHQMNLAKELTKIISAWNPRILALDPTCPYYFSKFNDTLSSENDLNLLSYLQAIDSNETVAYPFVNVLPQSYRSALPFLSIFHCREFLSPTSNSFFHNIELIIGPGQTELPLQRQSNQFSQLYCSLHGWPHFLLVNQTKQPTITYDGQTLLSQDNLADVEFFLTSLAPGRCLFVPSDWVTGVQLNNSISLVFTLKKLEKLITNQANNEPLPCTKTRESTLETIQFAIEDTFNISKIGLIIYFYEYLNPPMFDKEFTNEIFFDYFREDKNISQLIMKWTPELIELIKIKLFQQIDINHDEKFSIDDYFDIKRSNVNQLQEFILEILEEIRETILLQYNELSETMKKIIQQSENHELNDNDEEILETMIENLPDLVKARFEQNNINVIEVLNKIKSKKSKRSSTNKQRVKDNKQSNLTVNQDQEEEITSENELYRDDL